MPIRPRSQPRPRTRLLRHWTLWAWFALAVALSVGGVGLWRSGRWLVHEDPAARAKWGVVLAGETRDCERTDAAARLVQEGRIDSLILSSTRIFKNRYESEFLLDYLAKQGVPRDRVFEFHQDAYSTQEEARLLVRQFRLQNLDTVLVVTSSFHTARARRIFRKLAQGYPVVLVAAADYHLYDPAAWWSNRESRKIWFYEWMKTLFTAYELWRARPETGKAEYQGLIPDPGLAGPRDASGDPSGAIEGGPADSAGAGESANPEASGTGTDGIRDAAADSSGSDGHGAGKPADSASARKDSAQAAAEAKDAAEIARSAEEAPAEAARPAAESKGLREPEAKKAQPQHQAAKKPAPAAKPAPKREEKKPEKAKKKG